MHLTLKIVIVSLLNNLAGLTVSKTFFMSKYHGHAIMKGGVENLG